MNKDDMSDDAEFDAFLKGEGDLARRLQGLAQPGPSAALDAAILANARAAMAREPRPVAANDSGDALPAPRLAPGLGWRWRVPAGIAATVLVGVFAQQTLQTGGDLNETSVPMAAIEQAGVSPAPAAEVQAAVQDAPVAAPEPVVEVAPVAEPEAKAAVPVARAAVPSELKRSAVSPQRPAPPPKAAAPAVDAYAPPPVMEMPVAVAPVPADEDRYERAREERSSYARSQAQKSKAAPAMRNNETAEPAVFGALSDLAKPAPPPPPAPAPAAPAAAVGNTASVEVAGRRNRVETTSESVNSIGVVADKAGPTAREWLDRIETLLAEGKKDEALADWKAFRKAYPEYPVPDATRAKLE